MAQRRRGLGRGIGALIPESQEEVRESPISVFFGGAVSRETEEVTINEGDVEREGAATGRSGNGKKNKCGGFT